MKFGEAPASNPLEWPIAFVRWRALPIAAPIKVLLFIRVGANSIAEVRKMITIMARQESTGLIRTIRRHQLRELVPLADSTIYEMEQRGEFPRRIALSPRCVEWDLSEVEAWQSLRRSATLARAP